MFRAQTPSSRGSRGATALLIGATSALACLASCRAIRGDYDPPPADDAGAVDAAEVYLERVVVSTLAGGADPGGSDGIGTSASFANPVGLSLDASGALLVAEYDGGRIRKVGPDGATSFVAGGLSRPFALTVAGEATYVTTDHGAGGVEGPTAATLWRLGSAAPELVAAGFSRPRGLATRSDGRIVLSDRGRHALIVVDPATGSSSVLAGGGSAGFADGVGEAARFSEPAGLTALPDGSVVVADTANHALRRVTTDGVVTTFAGDGTAGMLDEADRLRARFDRPVAVTADLTGNVYVSDEGNHRIRLVAASGAVQTIAGDGTAGFADGDGRAARFVAQPSIQVSPDGKALYVSDGHAERGAGASHRIRKIQLP